MCMVHWLVVLVVIVPALIVLVVLVFLLALALVVLTCASTQDMVYIANAQGHIRAKTLSNYVSSD